MDVLNAYGLYVGIFLALLSAGATFFNKQRFVAQAQLLQAGNDELRNQNQDLRNERTDLVTQKAELTATCKAKDTLIKELKNQPNLTELTRTISNNHTQVIEILGSITKLVARGPNVKQR